MRSLPARFIPKERIDPKVLDRTLDRASLNGRILLLQLRLTQKYGDFYHPHQPIRCVPYLSKLFHNKQSDPLNVIRQVVRLSRSAVSVLLVPLANGSNHRVAFLEAERDLRSIPLPVPTSFDAFSKSFICSGRTVTSFLSSTSMASLSSSSSESSPMLSTFGF